MTILALDLGTTTGFAWCAVPGTVISGTWSFKPERHESEGMRYLRMREQLDRMHKTCGVKVIYFEAVHRHVGTHAAHVYGGLLGVLKGWCCECGVEYDGVGVGTIKKAWTGKGNASKQEMIDECVARGYAPIDDNEADAIALLTMKITVPVATSDMVG